MCGRYSVLTEDEIINIRAVLHDISLRLAKDEPGAPPQSGEVRPTDSAPVLSMDARGISFENAVFGFQKWDGKGVIINARAETLQRPGNHFSKIKSVGRCVVPAGAYFEWKTQQDTTKKDKKIKHMIQDKTGNLLFFAGLYQDTAAGRAFVIITKNAHGDVADIHHRMPVILLPHQLEAWLNGTLTPADIAALSFNATVQPCEKDDGQMKLF